MQFLFTNRSKITCFVMLHCNLWLRYRLYRCCYVDSSYCDQCLLYRHFYCRLFLLFNVVFVCGWVFRCNPLCCCYLGSIINFGIRAIAANAVWALMTPKMITADYLESVYHLNTTPKRMILLYQISNTATFTSFHPFSNHSYRYWQSNNYSSRFIDHQYFPKYY